MWNGIEVLFLLKEHLSAVLVPVVPEVVLDVSLEVRLDIEATAIWLVLDASDEVEPLLQFLLIVAFVLPFHRHNDVLELVHKDGEEGHTEDLNDATEYLLHDRDWTRVTIAYR